MNKGIPKRKGMTEFSFFDKNTEISTMTPQNIAFISVTYHIELTFAKAIDCAVEMTVSELIKYKNTEANSAPKMFLTKTRHLSVNFMSVPATPVYNLIFSLTIDMIPNENNTAPTIPPTLRYINAPNDINIPLRKSFIQKNLNSPILYLIQMI